MARETVTFEHIATKADGYEKAVPDGYDGFHWDNVQAYKTGGNSPFNGGPAGGYAVGVHSGDSGAFNNSGLDASFSADTTFSLKSGYFTGAWRPGQVTLTAFVGGIEVGHKSFTVVDTSQTFVEFGHHFRHIDSVTISTGLTGAFTQVAMDDLNVIFDGAIPTVAEHSPHRAPAHEMDLAPADFSAPYHGSEHWMFC